MTRARLVSLLLTGGMLLSMVGCCWNRPLLNRPWLPRWRAAHHHEWCEPVCCEGGAVMSGPIMPGSPPPVITTQPPVAPTPRVVPVPQTAAPLQYTP